MHQNGNVPMTPGEPGVPGTDHYRYDGVTDGDLITGMHQGWVERWRAPENAVNSQTQL